jgi:hypothetical protein
MADDKNRRADFIDAQQKTEPIERLGRKIADIQSDLGLTEPAKAAEIGASIASKLADDICDSLQSDDPGSRKA